MKKIYYYILLFFIPHLLYVSITYYLDPFNYLKKENISGITDEKVISDKMSNSTHYAYNYSQLMNSHNKVILGDSRAKTLNIINDDLEIEDFFSLIHFRGLNIKEMSKINDETNFFENSDEVVLFVSFDQFNDLKDYDRISQQKKIYDSMNFLSHAYNINTIKLSSIIFTIKIGSFFSNEFENKFFSIFLNKNNSKKDKNVFWEWHLKNVIKRDFDDFQYSYANEMLLKKIVKNCNLNNTKLTIVIPPSHIEYIDAQKSFVSDERKEFFRFMYTLNTLVVNYENNSNQYIYDKSQFKDSMHVNSRIDFKDSSIDLKRIINKEISTQNFKIGVTNNDINFITYSE